MNVNGKNEFNVSREQLWAYLMDVEVLTKITPGLSKLEPVGDDQFKTNSRFKIGLFKSNFTGKMLVLNKQEPTAFQIEMEQLSMIGNVYITIQMNLEESDDNNTLLTFDGNANLTGIIARTSSLVLYGATTAITKKIFSALAKHIEENRIP